jgi:hypothetical protein
MPKLFLSHPYAWDERERLHALELEKYQRHQEAVAPVCEQARRWALANGKTWEEAMAAFHIVPVGPPGSA